METRSNDNGLCHQVEQRIGTFPHVLKKMLTDKRIKPYMQWNHSGTYFFFAHNDSTIENGHVLCRFFRHNSLKSFVRQLQSYQFKRVDIPESTYGGYIHQYFQRNSQELKKVKRVSLKRNLKTVNASPCHVENSLVSQNSQHNAENEMHTDLLCKIAWLDSEIREIQLRNLQLSEMSLNLDRQKQLLFDAHRNVLRDNWNLEAKMENLQQQLFFLDSVLESGSDNTS